MEPQTVFYIIIAILLADFFIDQVLDYLNYTRFDAPVPKELSDVYPTDEYHRSQQYKKTNYRFSVIKSWVSIVITLLFFTLGGFEWADRLALNISSQPILRALLFFGILSVLSGLLSLPFSLYHTFVIEERFGFNKTTPKTFVTDKIKGALLAVVFGGGILALFMLFYQYTGTNFWIYAWILITLVSVLTNMFYSRLIVPLFNKQTPLEQGSLREKIEAYAQKEGFELQKIFVIDGSKRSTKANAYFSGFGKEKRVTLYDTLINDLEEEEVVAVLAHEVGHYKKNHILFNLFASVVLTGLTLFLLSLFLRVPELSLGIGVSEPSFHAGLLAFGMLYSPISAVTGLAMNLLSRKFEYQADAFARITYRAAPLVNALKKLSKNSLSNLTPHPAYVFAHYSHPRLYDRIKALQA
ncbi:M48 family peptidase [Robertkochia marina]|uniref:M48 family peptidase n=1 Tax=Robertkochia marina TaxID=1227945 RepID=A0A4S3LYR4_9FLAO|nr:M48 family metallopeptidase [Robertkochia marina]THD66566.1 M48 family peptidase [Robertkochia marina]TRZ45595.1 M48 family peptidase [Robertkochia marina]